MTRLQLFLITGGFRGLLRYYRWRLRDWWYRCYNG